MLYGPVVADRSAAASVAAACWAVDGDPLRLPAALEQDQPKSNPLALVHLQELRRGKAFGSQPSQPGHSSFLGSANESGAGFLQADAEPFRSGIGSSIPLAFSLRNTFFIVFSLLIPVISRATLFVISW